MNLSRISRIAAAAMVCFASLPSTCSADEASAVQSQRVHPVLVRKEFNPLLKLAITAPSDGASLTEVRFSLSGTDDVRDVQSLDLFVAGENQEFSSAERFGERTKAGEEASFSGDKKLEPGENVFWLSCTLADDASLDRRIAVQCTAVETSLGEVVPAGAAPAVRHRIGVALRQQNEDGVHTYRIPALATTPRGTLLAVYDMRRRAGRDLQEDIDIGLSRSRDGGQTWESPRVIMDMGEYGGLPQEQNGCSDPGIIVDRQTGEVFCFAVWMNGKPGKHQWTDDGSEPGFEIGKSAQMLMVRSIDDGLTWSAPENLTRKLKQPAWWLIAPSPQQGICLDDGTLVMPCQGRDEQGAPFATLLVSSDHGDSWDVRTPAFSGGNECQAALLGDGSIMLNMRNDHDRWRAVFVTRDLGATWTPHATNRRALIEPNCNGSLYRFDLKKSGEARHVLLFSNPHSQTARTHQTIQVSFDDGVTWPEAHHLLLDEGRGAGYPSLTRVDDAHVGIVYEGSQAHLVFERIAIQDLLTGAVP